MSDFTSLRSLIEFYVKSLHLNRQAPYPTLRIETMKDIKRYQMAQEHVKPHLVGNEEHDDEHA